MSEVTQKDIKQRDIKDKNKIIQAFSNKKYQNYLKFIYIHRMSRKKLSKFSSRLGTKPADKERRGIVRSIGFKDNRYENYILTEREVSYMICDVIGNQSTISSYHT